MCTFIFPWCFMISVSFLCVFFRSFLNQCWAQKFERARIFFGISYWYLVNTVRSPKDQSKIKRKLILVFPCKILMIHFSHKIIRPVQIQRSIEKSSYLNNHRSGKQMNWLQFISIQPYPLNNCDDRHDY